MIFFCAPQSEYWLSTLARNCKENVNIVAGFTNYDDDAPDFWRFEHFLYVMLSYARSTKKELHTPGIQMPYYLKKMNFLQKKVLEEI